MPDPNTQMMACMEVWGGNALVSNSVAMPGLDAWVYSRPFAMAQEGGDVYYVSSCAHGRIMRLLVADVSGHGEKVRGIAGALRDLMRRFVNHQDQREFLRSMNRQFTELTSDGCFATAVVTTFFGPTNHLTLCNAGHPTPMLYRARTGKWRLLERGAPQSDGLADIPMGIDGMSDYEQMAVQLEVGDLVLCYSDSLTESRDRTGEMLGEKGLLQLAGEIDVSVPEKVVERLIEAITKRAEGNLDADDVTVLLFRPNGILPPATLWEKVLAPIRMWAAVIRSIFPGGGPPPLPEMHLPSFGSFKKTTDSHLF